MLRRHLITSVALSAIVFVGLGLVYPLAVFAVAKLAFGDRADGSFVERGGQAVGSALIGQAFLDEEGNPDPRYFQSRPSAAGAGYDPTASAATNLGPGDPRLVGFVPGVNTVDLDGNPSPTNPFATDADPYCVPLDTEANPVPSPSGGEQYATDDVGDYVCYPNTIPQRVLAYRGSTTSTRR